MSETLSDEWFGSMPSETDGSKAWDAWRKYVTDGIAELEAEIARLKVWGSDSHVTDLERKLAEVEKDARNWQIVAEEAGQDWKEALAEIERLLSERDEWHRIAIGLPAQTENDDG